MQGQKHVKATPVSAKDYPRDEILKANQPYETDRINEPLDHFTLVHIHEHSNEMEMERNDMAKTFIPTCQTCYSHYNHQVA